MPKIIQGTHHYVELEGSGYTVKRIDNDEIAGGWAPDPYGLWTGDKEDVESMERDALYDLELADKSAENFIQHGKQEAWEAVQKLIYPAPETDDWQCAYEMLTADLAAYFSDITIGSNSES